MAKFRLITTTTAPSIDYRFPVDRLMVSACR